MRRTRKINANRRHIIQKNRVRRLIPPKGAGEFSYCRRVFILHASLTTFLVAETMPISINSLKYIVNLICCCITQNRQGHTVVKETRKTLTIKILNILIVFIR